MTALVEFEGISKRFGSVEACVEVDFRVERGEIHALLGENGAGKSTLMKILYGMYAPDAGRIVLDGEERALRTPNEAMELGIGMVHQQLSLIRELLAWENAALGERGRLSRSATIDRMAELSDQYGLGVDPFAVVGDLGVAQQQRLEVLKCLARDPRILILDEPTSVLTGEESEALFDVLRPIVAEEGRSVLLISHKLDEVLAAADRITVMRAGRVVVHGTPAAEAEPGMLARAIVGDKASVSVVTTRGISREDSIAETEAPAETGADRRSAFALDGLTASRAHGGENLKGLSLEIRPGEIVGLAGVDGNGQELLEDVLCGFVPYSNGVVRVGGRAVDPRIPGAMQRAGVAVIASDRHANGSATNMTLRDNLVVDLDERRRFTRFGVVVLRHLRSLARRLIGDFRIRAGSPEVPFWSLSGGNQQRAVFARELLGATGVLLACQPTKGLDVAAIQEMRDRLSDLAADGVGILLISNDLDEILELCGRVAVISDGQIIGEVSREEATAERLGALLGGSVELGRASSDDGEEPAPATSRSR